MITIPANTPQYVANNHKADKITLRQLSDSFGRRFNYLRLSITDVCNFRCNYCLPDGYCSSEKTDNLSLTEIHTLVSAFASMGTKKIRITGGEPSLRKDYIDIIECCKSIDGIETVALTTNGYRIDKDLKRLHAAGLDALNLSADSLDPDTFQLITGHKKLTKVLDAVDEAIALGISRVKLNAVLLREYNLRELRQFMAYVKSRPVSVRFIELMQTGDNEDFFTRQHVSGTAVQSVLEHEGWMQVMKRDDDGPAVAFRHPDYQGSIGLIMPYSKDFCQSCNRLRVSSAGNLHLCLFSESNIPLMRWLSTGDATLVAEKIQQYVSDKTQGHRLHEGFSGSTKQLAMIGG